MPTIFSAVSCRRYVEPPSPEDVEEVPGVDPKPRSPVVAGFTPEVPAEDQHPEDLGGVSVTNSEVKSMMNHRRHKASLWHSVFSNQEFNALSSVDVYLGAART